MTIEDINRMAQKAGFPERRAFSDLSDLYPRLERFAELVRADEREVRSMRWDEYIAKAITDEREACARACEGEANRAKWNWDNDISGNQPFWNGGEQLASSCAAVIRARGQT